MLEGLRKSGGKGRMFVGGSECMKCISIITAMPSLSVFFPLLCIYSLLHIRLPIEGNSSFLCSIKGILRESIPVNTCSIIIICVDDKRNFCKGTFLFVHVFPEKRNFCKEASFLLLVLAVL